jgi:predicted hydrocarbon binding protein
VTGEDLQRADGRLLFRGGRYLLIRPETLAGLQHAVERALGASAADCFMAGGLAGGSKATSAVSGDRHERVEGLLATGTAIGWGEFALEHLDATTLVVTVGDSPFAAAYGPAAAPVCHLTRGVLQSLAAAIFGPAAAVDETACAAAGARRCRFEARA